MRLTKLHICTTLIAVSVIMACKHKAKQEDTATPVVFKGLYSFEVGAKTFQACGGQKQYLVVDSGAQLELKYTQLVVSEKTGEPVYIEVEGKKAKSFNAGYDGTLIVKKVVKITKDIPADCK